MGYRDELLDCHCTSNPTEKVQRATVSPAFKTMVYQGTFVALLSLTITVYVHSVPIANKNVGIPEHLRENFERAAAEESHPKRKRAVPPIVAEKAIEIGGKLAEKTAEKLFEKIGEAGDRANDYIRNGATVDVQPQNTFMTEDLLAPPAWHISAHTEADKPEESSTEPAAFNYPNGMGSVMWNGCYGSGYKLGDPCYETRLVSASTCKDMMEGAGFIGVGFDGRGEYSPESRKMSIIQRNCAALSTYHDEDVPDTMNVHGIYETKSSQFTFSSREEYSSHLQTEAGVSGSYFFFSAGVSSAYGTSTRSNTQMFMSQMDIDVIRYEIFQDEVKASDLSVNFVKEFMELPKSYVTSDAAFKYQDFILRWGTHYIKSAEFGGRLTLRKTSMASFFTTVEEFAVEAKVDYDAFFASFHAKMSTSGGNSKTKQTNYGSTTITALGGNAEIAALVSDGGTPTTRTDLVNWLDSIPKYPKPFKFRIAPITDLLFFQPSDLFPNDGTSWDCNSLPADLLHKEGTGSDEKTYYYSKRTENGEDVSKKVYCSYKSKDVFMAEIAQRRAALEKATSVYLSEGVIPESDFSVSAGHENCGFVPPTRGSEERPNWDYIMQGKSVTIVFEMEDDIEVGVLGKSISKDFVAQIHYYANRWFVETGDGRERLSDGSANGGCGEISNKKICVYGLVLTFSENTNMLLMNSDDYIASKRLWPRLFNDLKNRFVAKLEWPAKSRVRPGQSQLTTSLTTRVPCNVKWSNVQTFDVKSGGKCIFFGAVSQASIFVVFAAVPKSRRTWYYIDISPQGATIYKGDHVLTATENKNSRGLGSDKLQQGYFACMSMVGSAILIEYGKFSGSEETRVVYAAYKDSHNPIIPTYYAFGSSGSNVIITTVNVSPRSIISSTNCGVGTEVTTEHEVIFCKSRCHEECDADYSCLISENGIPSPTLCNKCKTITISRGVVTECGQSCNIPTQSHGSDLICPCKWSRGVCVETCPDGTSFEATNNECLTNCGDPGDIDGGSKVGTTYTNGASVTYTCNTGYSIEGAGVILCSHTKWRPDPPTCVRDRAMCIEPVVPHSTREGDDFQIGSTVTFKCDDHYYISRGKASSKCVSGSWQDLPVCSTKWRSDYQCGPNYPLSNRQPSECRTDTIYACCGANGGCGETADECFCDDCKDYRPVYSVSVTRADRRCGGNYMTDGNTAAGCDPRSEGKLYCCVAGYCENHPTCDCEDCINFSQLYDIPL